MKNNTLDYCFCIPTYNRNRSLMNLLRKLENQTVRPDILVIADGEPASGTVLCYLESYLNKVTYQTKIVYIPANHANLPYQRYLGWKVAMRFSSKYLVYLDDDLRPAKPETIHNLLRPLQVETGIIGVTANIVYSTGRNVKEDNRFVRFFGDSREYGPGNITPAGNRISVEFDGTNYVPVDFLSGGAMAFLTMAITENVFSRDLFAMYEKKIGKGEDTILSLRLHGSQPYLYAFNSVFFHPNNKAVAYPTDSFKNGFAIAYSRRLINDNYRGLNPPYLRDRLALIKSYLGNNLINFVKALTHPKRYRFAYALGYFMGSLRGLIQKPSASNLTPDIDWEADAEKAISQAVVIRVGKE